jgi:hypothetical protein
MYLTDELALLADQFNSVAANPDVARSVLNRCKALHSGLTGQAVLQSNSDTLHR